MLIALERSADRELAASSRDLPCGQTDRWAEEQQWRLSSEHLMFIYIEYLHS